MVQTIDADRIRTGWTAYDVRGEKIGDVAEIGSNYLLVVKGLFLRTDLYVPLSRVVSLDEAQSTFEVNVPKEKAEAMGWQNSPADASWDAADATDSLDVPLREGSSDAVRGYVDADEVRRVRDRSARSRSATGTVGRAEGSTDNVRPRLLSRMRRA